MRLSMLLSTASVAVCLPCLAADSLGISAPRILERTKIMASDEFEGRAPGSAGEEKTIQYLLQEFKQLGLQPGHPKGGFIQDVPLVGITSLPTLTLTAGSETINLQHRLEFVGPTSRSAEHIKVDGSELVFVGYGIVAPEYGWDDYKGVDVRGKTVVMLINDPPVIDSATGKLDANVFGGLAMTYYGRWTYKYEIAAAKGAAACLIAHETGPAAYPFAVVVTSRSRENFEIRTADGNAGRCAMDGWLTLDATKRIFTAAGQDFDTAKRAAATREFTPVPLAAKASFTIQSTLRPVDSRNVVAVLPGSDPKLRDEYVIYTSHWDHLGRDPKLSGDQIYNGAADNAAGTAVLLEIAEAYQALPLDQKPKRSILFLSITAEEKGLLGSRYYAENPLYPLTKTVANINMDGANQFGRTRDMQTIGYGLSTIDDIGAAVAKSQGRTMEGERNPERGMYFRSDHFEFAKVGVPSYYARSGRQFIDQPEDYGDRIVNQYILRDYHQVSDEVKPDWTFEGAAQDTEFLVKVGLEIANAAEWPQWRESAQFKARRDAMLKR